jgi:hypothetical protein
MLVHGWWAGLLLPKLVEIGAAGTRPQAGPYCEKFWLAQRPEI